MERVRNLTNKIYREILYITRHESTKYITMAGLDVPVNAFPWTLHRGIAVSWDLLDYLTMEGEIPCSFTNFITTSKLSGALYINLVCGPMLCTAVRGLSFFCNIYIRIYIINNNEIYKYIYIFKKNISDVYVYYVKVYCQCDFKSHTDNILLHNEHIHHLFFFF